MREVRRACNSSTRCAAVGGEAPRSADSIVPRSCFGDTIFSPLTGETLKLEAERGKRKRCVPLGPLEREMKQWGFTED